MSKFAYLWVFILFGFTGCSGCSQSGLRHQATKQLSLNEKSSDPNIRSYNQNEGNDISDSNAQYSENSLTSLYNKYKSAVFTVYTSDKEYIYQGSGFFINQYGLAVSNYHIFDGKMVGNEIIVTETGKELIISRIIEQNKDKDYIIFEVGVESRVNFMPLARISPEIGETVFAISNPRGLSHSLTTGIVSAYRQGHEIIQTTAEITHGSSGGALLNMKGEVVGITTSGYGEANLNFALNILELRLDRYIK